MTATSELHKIEKELARFRLIARTMDEMFKIPILNLSIGLDGLLGFIPIFGDVTGFVVSAYLLFTAFRLNAPNVLLGHMFVNIVIDLLIGVIPLIGDIFDFAWKANLRNLKLLERHIEAPIRAKRSSYRFFFTLIAMNVALLAGAIWTGTWLLGLLRAAAP